MKKTNKTFKRFAAITSASLLAACAMAPVAFNAFAAGENLSITINDNGIVDASKHSFAAYQIFTGELNATKTGFVGGTVVWGKNVDPEAFITKIKAAFPSNTAILALIEKDDADDETIKQSTAYDVALALESITSDSSDAKLLAKTISSLDLGALGAAAGTYTGGGTEATITGLDAGYYFVKDISTMSGETSDALSQFILKLTNDAEVDIKTDAPTLEKKIWHNDDANSVTPNTDAFATTVPTFNTQDVLGNGWADVGDNQIGDTIYYVIKTAVPDMSDYDTYKYIIHDDMDAGLTMGSVTNIVYFADGATTATTITVETDSTKNDNTDALVTVNGNDFTVDFGDLKTVLPNANGGYIYTYYTATLNENAEVSASINDTQNNPNTAYLEYSNNPNVSGEGDTENTGRTPDDTVYDWTYTFNASKVDEKGDPLAGAKFQLQDAKGNVIPLIVATPTKINDVTEAAANTLYYRPALANEEGSTDVIETTASANKFVFVGLDDTKTYKLVETEAPQNYNKAANPFALIITNSYKDTDPATVDTGNKVVTITRTVDGSASNNAEIVNRKGASLPGTGGIGTTIFYLGGGAMAAIGGIYLISKRRMKKSEE